MRDDDPRRMRHRSRRCSAGLERLSRLVSQLLALARNEPEAARHITMAAVDLNALAFESASGWVPEALKKGIDLGFEGAEQRRCRCAATRHGCASCSTTCSTTRCATAAKAGASR